MQMTQNNPMFTDITSEEAATYNGGFSFKSWFRGPHPFIKRFVLGGLKALF